MTSRPCGYLAFSSPSLITGAFFKENPKITINFEKNLQKFIILFIIKSIKTCVILYKSGL